MGEPTMSYYSVFEVTPITKEWMPDYIDPAAALVEKHGGEYLARTSTHERLEGEGEEVALRVIIQWPSKESALDFMKDPDYVPLLKLRTSGSNSHHFLIEGKNDFA
jgi:uncharacterized protein (DUF1330 family)